MADGIDTPHVYLTLEDDYSTVLELVKVDGEDMYVRENGAWSVLPDDPDNDRVWDRFIVDVDETQAAALYDEMERGGVEMTSNSFTAAMLEDEEAS